MYFITISYKYFRLQNFFGLVIGIMCLSCYFCERRKYSSLSPKLRVFFSRYLAVQDVLGVPKKSFDFTEIFNLSRVCEYRATFCKWILTNGQAAASRIINATKRTIMVFLAELTEHEEYDTLTHSLNFSSPGHIICGPR